MGPTFFAVMLTILADVGQPIDLASIRGENLDDRYFEVVLDRERGDVPLSVIGEFDIGAARDLQNSDYHHVIAKAMEFVARHPEVFYISSMGRMPELRISRVSSDYEDYTIIHVDPYLDGLRVFDSELTFVFWGSGMLHSINGALESVDVHSAKPVPANEVMAFLSTELGDEGLTENLAGSDNGIFTGVNNDNISLELGIDRYMQTVVWRYIDEGIEIRLDADHLTPLIVRSTRDDLLNDTYGACYMNHSNWTRDASGRATSVVYKNGYSHHWVTCGADSWFGTCYWHLKYEPSGISHKIARIDDADYSETEIAMSCGGVPDFLSTGETNHYFKQQNVFYNNSRMRTYLSANVWNFITPDREDIVEVHIDESPGTPYWDDIFTGIHMDSSWSQRMDVLWHEYGHYAVWTYNDVSNWCTSSDHGDALDETLADCFAMIQIADDNFINALYQPTLGSYVTFGGQFPEAHNCADNKLVGLLTCNNDHHIVGRSFEQAFWELLWNKNIDNCTKAACRLSGEFSSMVWPTATQDQVIEYMGKSLGHALKVLGPNVTFYQVIAQMYNRWVTDTGTTGANNARAVFTHHGL